MADAFATGREEGLAIGRNIGREKGIATGWEESVQEGILIGRIEVCQKVLREPATPRATLEAMPRAELEALSARLEREAMPPDENS